MRKLTEYLFFIFVISGCFSEPSFDEKNYEFFVITETPEDRLYYPEEELVFVFSAEPSAETSENISFECEIEEECSAEIHIDEKKLFISKLPPKDKITLTFESGIKSSDKRPLVVENEDGYAADDIVFTYVTGPPLPSVKKLIPEKTMSRTVLVNFDSPVDISPADILPPPELIRIDDEKLLIFLSDAVDRIVLKNVKSTLRPGKTEEIVLSFSEPVPDMDTQMEISLEESDISCEFQIHDESLVSIYADEKLQTCISDCVLAYEDLTPRSDFSLEAEFFGLKRRYEKVLSCSTDAPRPRIMISEVMHNPLGEPGKSREFVEVYNIGEVDFSFKGCFIDDRDDEKGMDALSVEGGNVLEPDRTGVITADESSIPEELPDSVLIIKGDDTSLADGGLTSTRSLQIKCPSDEGLKTAASYDSSYGRTEKGHSVVIDEEGNMCESREKGGSPGIFTSCEEEIDTQVSHMQNSSRFTRTPYMKANLKIFENPKMSNDN